MQMNIGMQEKSAVVVLQFKASSSLSESNNGAKSGNYSSTQASRGNKLVTPTKGSNAAASISVEDVLADKASGSKLLKMAKVGLRLLCSKSTLT